MKVQVFKCEFTGKLFESEKEYDSHVEMLLAEMDKIEKENELLANQETIKNSPRLTATSIDDFRLKVIDAVNTLTQNHSNKLVSLEFTNLRFENISVTHSAPIGCETNFWRNNDKPTSYLGWNGTITITFAKEKNHDDIQKLVQYFPAINTGSGGSRNDYGKYFVLEFELRLYLQDFPLMQKEHERYKELMHKESEWKNKINTLCNDANENDEKVKYFTKLYDEYTQKINDLLEERKNVASSIANSKNININKIHSENPFEESDELIILSNIFKSRYY